MNATDDIIALLGDAEEQIELATTLHDKAMSSPTARGPFKSRIKNILEHQRSALDYLAVAITTKYGRSKGLIYYPLAPDESQFASEMDRKMPGVAAAEPQIATAIKRFQPYGPTGEWLRHLNQLTREQKHNRLSTQLVKQTYQCEVVEKATGATVRWHGLRFEPGLIDSEGGTIDFGNLGERDPAAPMPFELAGPTGFLVFGVPLDPSTQRPFPTPQLEVRSGPLHRWSFASPHIPVLLSLTEFQRNVRKAVSEIARSARL
jgi:hypothetical protein